MDRRKILLIFGGAWVSALLLTWFLYARTQAPKTAKTVQVAASARPMAAGTRIRKADLKMVAMPDSDLPGGAILDVKETMDRALLFPVMANEPLTAAKLTTLAGAEGLPATIEPGKRAISVPITDSSGVAGLIQPRSHVDVIFTRSGSMADAVTTTILQDIVVLAIGRVTEVVPMDTKATRPQTQAATLLVTPEQAGKLELAKNQGKISLALRNPLDRSTVEQGASVTAEVLDPNLFVRRRPAGKIPNVRDDRVWAQLTGGEEPKPKPPEKKEPPKPRVIIDVYRGDKHVQEAFQ